MLTTQSIYIVCNIAVIFVEKKNVRKYWKRTEVFFCSKQQQCPTYKLYKKKTPQIGQHLVFGLHDPKQRKNSGGGLCGGGSSKWIKFQHKVGVGDRSAACGGAKH